MAAAVGAMDDVVQLQPARGAAARQPATSAVAPPHEPRDAGWNVLMRALRGVAIEQSEVLGVAQGALDRRGADRELRAGTFLPTLLAARADGHGNLELRAPGRLGSGRAIEHRAAQRGDERIIGQVLAVLVIDDGAGLAQEREGSGRELEAPRRGCAPRGRVDRRVGHPGGDRRRAPQSGEGSCRARQSTTPRSPGSPHGSARARPRRQARPGQARR